ncbi:Uncharacterised protein [Chlamydia trachomatis]|nr:Uncharacterised protein [Chlamydia trachomatis]
MATDDSVNNKVAKMSGLRRPYLSLSGPMMSCPTARPAMLAVSPKFTIDGPVLKKVATLANMGPRVLLMRGANAVKAPNKAIKKILYRRSI